MSSAPSEISMGEMSASSLRQRIETVENMLVRHVVERDVLCGQFGPIVYPVLSLPPEITSRIFMQSLPPDRWLEPSPYLSPLLLTQICKQWREIALDMPELWRSIGGMSPRSKSFGKILELWLSRANHRQLSCGFDWHPTIAEDLAESLGAHCQQWVDIKVILPLGPLKSLMRMGERGFPSLRAISLGLDPLALPFTEETVRIVIMNAPLLRSVSIVASRHLIIELPWHQLHSVDVDPLNLEDCISILRRCPLLVSLRIGVYASPPVKSISGIISLPRLRSVISRQYPAFLQYIVAPQLQEFTVALMTSDHIALIQAFFSRSSPPLTRVGVDAPLSPEIFQQFLHFLPPSVVQLDVGRSSKIHDLTAHIHALGSPDSVPELRALRLELAAAQVADPCLRAIVDMLHSRCEAQDLHSSLETFELCLPFSGSQRTMSQFKALAENGLQLRITVEGLDTVTSDLFPASRGLAAMGASPPPDVVVGLRRKNAAITALITERDRLRHIADTLIGYPVLSLPNEVTVEIFIQCLPDGPTPPPSPFSVPLLLAQICCQWRRIALGTPALWRHMAIGESGREFTPGCVQLLQLWLARSRNQSLDCVLTSADTSGAESLLEASLLHCERWKQMSISIPVTGSAFIAGPTFQDRKFPALQKLSVEYGAVVGFRGAPRSLDPQVIRTSVKDAPLLRDVSIRLSPMHSLQVNFPWYQLYKLSLDSPDAKDCIALLRCCKHLVSLHLSTSGPMSLTSPPITLDCLQYLDVPPAFLHNLTCSNLQELIMTHPVPEEIPVLDAFTSRSACSPSRMSWTSIRFLPLPIYSLPSSVEQLDLRWSGRRLEPSEFERNMQLLHSEDALRSLKVFRLSFEPYNEAEWTAILSLATARRRRHEHRLETFELAIRTDKTAKPRFATLTAFRALEAEGLNVRITRTSMGFINKDILNTLTEISPFEPKIPTFESHYMT